MDENVDDEWKWMNFFMNVGKKKFGWKTKQKKRLKKFMVVGFVGPFTRNGLFRWWSR
jgi:hypothetical protein